MTNAELIKREKWMALNRKVNQAIKTMNQNEKAGYPADDQYKEWLNNLIKERDLLS